MRLYQQTVFHGINFPGTGAEYRKRWFIFARIRNCRNGKDILTSVKEGNNMKRHTKSPLTAGLLLTAIISAPMATMAADSEVSTFDLTSTVHGTLPPPEHTWVNNDGFTAKEGEKIGKLILSIPTGASVPAGEITMAINDMTSMRPGSRTIVFSSEYGDIGGMYVGKLQLDPAEARWSEKTVGENVTMYSVTTNPADPEAPPLSLDLIMQPGSGSLQPGNYIAHVSVQYYSV